MSGCPYAITPSDTRAVARRVHSAPVAINPDRDLDVLDTLQAEERLQLLASAARMATCTGAEA